MRPARLTSARLAVVLVAHGSRDPRASAATEALARAVRRRHPSWEVHASYLDHAGPRPLDVLASLAPGRRAVLVPLLLTAAYHGRVDVPAVVTAAADLPIEVRLADVLGAVPSALLLDGLVRRLDSAWPGAAGWNSAGPSAAEPGAAGWNSAGPSAAEPGAVGFGVAEPGAVGFGIAEPGAAAGLSAGEPGAVGLATAEPGAAPGLGLAGLGLAEPGGAGLDAVVLAAAGTRDAAARETIKRAAEALSARLSLPCAVAYSSAAPPEPGAAVAALRAEGARRVGMAAYFLAPGYLYDVAVRSAREAGAVTIAAPLGDAPELARLVGSRVDAALGHNLAAAA